MGFALVRAFFLKHAKSFGALDVRCTFSDDEGFRGSQVIDFLDIPAVLEKVMDKAWAFGRGRLGALVCCGTFFFFRCLRLQRKKLRKTDGSGFLFVFLGCHDSIFFE